MKTEFKICRKISENNVVFSTVLHQRFSTKNKVTCLWFALIPQTDVSNWYINIQQIRIVEQQKNSNKTKIIFNSFCFITFTCQYILIFILLYIHVYTLIQCYFHREYWKSKKEEDITECSYVSTFSNNSRPKAMVTYGKQTNEQTDHVTISRTQSDFEGSNLTNIKAQRYRPGSTT